MNNRLVLLLAFGMLLFVNIGAAQEKHADPDGVNAVFQDPLLDQMVGTWTLTGTIMGQQTTHRVEADWMLNHQFLRVHESEVAPRKASNVPYEAMIFIGYDHAGNRYVVHWIDVFGGKFSETLGYGKLDGNAIRFNFDYPDGGFHTNFFWAPQSKTWQWLMQTQGADKNWKEFANLTMSK